ncbi:hypothetical protein B0G84_8562 [Paraburkholderia sp. BL8N3]|nr:hypothetical protein [Paraburkholderia sp. BL8N3]TCK32708.1 hypothetical protein B0G84_8562 [Paraburkholderia sp. BL8N3]
MTWLVVLAGAHWRELSPDVFEEHGRRKEWSQLFCQSFDASGSMAEMQKGDVTIVVPHESIVMAVKTTSSG